MLNVRTLHLVMAGHNCLVLWLLSWSYIRCYFYELWQRGNPWFLAPLARSSQSWFWWCWGTWENIQRWNALILYHAISEENITSVAKFLEMLTYICCPFTRIGLILSAMQTDLLHLMLTRKRGSNCWFSVWAYSGRGGGMYLSGLTNFSWCILNVDIDCFVIINLSYDQASIV